MSKYRFPTDCAPIISKDDKIGWQECDVTDNTVSGDLKNRCQPCIPNEKTSCGQQMLAAGFEYAPPKCYSKCCKSEQASASLEDATKSTASKPFNRVLLFTLLSNAIFLMIVLVIAYFYNRNKKYQL